MSRARALVAITIGTVLAVGAVHAATAADRSEAAGSAVSRATPAWGVYVGPGSKNVQGASRFAAFSGLPITRVVDYPPADSWTDIEAPSWLTQPYRGSRLTLEYSLPLMPAARPGTSWSLAACARGDYDAHWETTAQRLVAAGLPDTVIRPGWEFNGTWYSWSAAGKVAAFAGCFRHVVTAMRSVPGTAFRFDWNPNLGPGSFPAEQAYPGDAYVDYVGVDVYDTSWAWYPAPRGMTAEVARQKAWGDVANGNHGLAFWRSFAAAHGKPMAFPEWGSTWRSDGHGGGDNPGFVDSMIDWITNPAGNVAYSVYFNPSDTATLRHDLMRADTAFPSTARSYRARATAYRTGSVPAAPPVAVPGASGEASPALGQLRALTVRPVSAWQRGAR